MKTQKKRGMLALLLAFMTVVSLVPGVGLAVVPTVTDIKYYLTQDDLATFAKLGEIPILRIHSGIDPVTKARVPGNSVWASPLTIPRFGGTYTVNFHPDGSTYTSTGYRITILQMAGYDIPEDGVTGPTGGNAVGPQHRAKAKTTIYSEPGGKSIGSLSAGQTVHVMFIASGMACLVSGGYVDYSALELIHGMKE